MKLILINIKFLVILKLCSAGLPYLGDRCNLIEKGQEIQATCRLLNDCPLAEEIFDTFGQLPQACAPHATNLVVCCSDAASISKSASKCQEYTSNVNCDMKEFVKEENVLTSTKYYPHVAKLIYYDVNTTENTHFNLEATLISERYVLTVEDALNTEGYILIMARLGMPVSIEPESFVDYAIDETILHPNFKSPLMNNGIVLIKLQKKVEFSENIRPICLPNTDTVPSINYRVFYDVNVENAPLAKYQRYTVSNYLCNSSYSYYDEYVNMDDNLMCTTAKELGDSIYDQRLDGAPIVANHPSVGCSHIFFGVSVMNVGPNLPSAAIKIYNYLGWIEAIIWADEEE